MSRTVAALKSATARRPSGVVSKRNTSVCANALTPLFVYIVRFSSSAYSPGSVVWINPIRCPLSPIDLLKLSTIATLRNGRISR